MIELSFIVAVIVLLAGLTMLAASHINSAVYKNTCISNIANGQKAMRSVSLIEGLAEGDAFEEYQITAIKSMYPGMECGASSSGERDLPTGWGSYTMGSSVPAVAGVFLKCKVAGDDLLFQHAPNSEKTGSW